MANNNTTNEGIKTMTRFSIQLENIDGTTSCDFTSPRHEDLATVQSQYDAMLSRAKAGSKAFASLANVAKIIVSVDEVFA